jgi:hypothetical protein
LLKVLGVSLDTLMAKGEEEVEGDEMDGEEDMETITAVQSITAPTKLGKAFYLLILIILRDNIRVANLGNFNRIRIRLLKTSGSGDGY